VNVSYGGVSSIRTSNATLTLTPLLILNCSNTVSNTTTLNVSIRVEDNNSLTTNNWLYSIFSVGLSNSTNKLANYTFYNISRSSYEFCLYPNTTISADILFHYGGTGFVDRYTELHNLTLTNSVRYHTLYQMFSTDSTIYYIHVRDYDDNPVTDCYVDVKKYYTDTNTYKTVESVKTDDNGVAVVHVESTNSTDTASYYMLSFKVDGEVKDETSPFVFAPDTTTGYHLYYRINLLDNIFDIFTNLRNIYFESISYNNVTGNFRCVLSDTTNTMISGCLNVTLREATGDTDVCSACDSGSSLTLLCDGGTNLSGNYFAQCYVNYGDDSEMWLVDTQSWYWNNDYLTWGNDFIVFGIIAVVGVMFFAGAVTGTAVAIVFGTVGIAALVMLKILPLSWTLLITLIILSILMAVRASKRRG